MTSPDTQPAEPRCREASQPASPRPAPTVRLAQPSDAPDIGRLLHDFNSEFDDPTPGEYWLAKRVRELIEGDQLTVLLVGPGPDGLAALRFRPSLWSAALECYLAELYVVSARRGQGLGRALLEAAMAHARERGADYMDLGTGETDKAARALYESCGFDNHEGKPDGPINYYYERAL
jgi:ribosomal protein S18 acetylase RimI-like enzyme